MPRTLTLIAATFALAFAGGVARAQTYGADVNAETARKVAAATIAECKKNNWKMAVAVVDTHGTLVHFEKIDDTQHASVRIAIEKARAAATFRRPTRVFMDAVNKTPATGTLPGVIGSPGGVPLTAGDKIIGAVGVSGGTGDQDEQCAKVGAGAL
jgi:glc operon protein GlcG